MNEIMPLTSFQVGTLNVSVYRNSAELGAAAAQAGSTYLQDHALQNDTLPVIFATGNSQIQTLNALTKNQDLPWKKVIAFHMDEYLGVSEKHPASFRHFLQVHLANKVPLLRSYMIDGSSSNSAQTCQEYANLLREHQPILCLLGIGENGHLAFNEPSEADFQDPYLLKVVTLDEVCRTQQVSEGWFPAIADVPQKAISLTIPALINVPKLIVSIPGRRKAQIVKRSLEDPISQACPSTILRKHPNATLYLDCDSASLILDSQIARVNS